MRNGKFKGGGGGEEDWRWEAKIGQRRGVSGEKDREILHRIT